MKEGFARCRLCKKDFAIGRRGPTGLQEHWKCEDRQLREIKLRLHFGMPLVYQNCVEASPREQKWQRSIVDG